MFARATSGDKRNNNRFSPCSLNAINPVLNSKARSPKGCFTGEFCHTETLRFFILRGGGLYRNLTSRESITFRLTFYSTIFALYVSFLFVFPLQNHKYHFAVTVLWKRVRSAIVAGRKIAETHVASLNDVIHRWRKPRVHLHQAPCAALVKYV